MEANVLDETILWRLEQHAAREPDRASFIFLDEGGAPGAQLSYRELRQRARAIAASLQRRLAPGERCLLAYPPGEHFLPAFLGCLYAGIVAVPIPCPRTARQIERLCVTRRDCDARLVLTLGALVPSLASWLDAAGERTPLWATDEPAAVDACGEFAQIHAHSDGLAYLQYTSGSTAAPRGVMVSHRNLSKNLEAIALVEENAHDSIAVTWLPHFHDMGLVEGLLEPLYGGFPCYVMSPAAFTVEPYRWLATISRYRATNSGAPNFAYDFCVKRVADEQRKQLELSCWRVAYNGAEPIRPETLARFERAFESAGFRRRTWYPVYGMAEATLLISSGSRTYEPQAIMVERAGIEAGRVRVCAQGDQSGRTLVASGRVDLISTEVAIVDPVNCRRCATDEIGEIWVRGPSIALGYWNRAADTKRVFCAELADGGEQGFLRTGDLGFVRDGELYVTGRHKDLIVVAGRNFYPDDIERVAGASHPALRADEVVAFGVERDGVEDVVVVAPLRRGGARGSTALGDVERALRAAVADACELSLHEVVLVHASGIARTSSGKLRRHLYLARYLENGFERVAIRVPAERSRAPLASAQMLLELAPDAGAAMLLEQLADMLSAIVGSSSERMAVDVPLIRLGLSSLGAMRLQSELEAAWSVRVPLAALYRQTSLRELANELLAKLSADDSTPAPAVARIPATTRALSRGQLSLWIAEHQAPDSGVGTIARAIRVRQSLDAGRVQRALLRLVESHAALRTTFRLEGGEPRRQVHAKLPAAFTTHDLSKLRARELECWLEEEAYRAFDLERGPLLRVALGRCEDGSSVLVIALSHLIADLWSLEILLGDFARFYTEPDTAIDRAEVRPQYDDFVAWEESALACGAFNAALAYWGERLAGMPAFEVHSELPRPASRTFRGATLGLRLPLELSEAARQLAREKGVSLPMLLLAALELLLFRHQRGAGVLGFVTGGRPQRDLEAVVGYFVNVLPFTLPLDAEESFSHLMARVGAAVLDALEHQACPMALVADTQPLSRRPDRTPLFDLAFVWQQTRASGTPGFVASALDVPGVELELGAFRAETLSLPVRGAYFDLTFAMGEVGAEIAGLVTYNPDVLDRASVERLTEHYLGLLRAVIARPDTPLARVPLITGEQQRSLWKRGLPRARAEGA